MTAPLRVLPDVEAIVIGFLRADSDVQALLGPPPTTRVYSKVPAQKSYPLVRVVRIPTSSMIAQVPPAEFERVILQIDSWGGPKKQAHDVGQTVRAALAHRLVGDATYGVGVIAVDLGSFGYLEDPEYEPPKDRYTGDVAVSVRPST